MSVTPEQLEKIKFLREAFAISQEALHQGRLAAGDASALAAEEARARFQTMWTRLVERTLKGSLAQRGRVGTLPQRCAAVLGEGHAAVAKLKQALLQHELALNTVQHAMRVQGDVGPAVIKLQSADQAIAAADAEAFAAARDHVVWQCNDLALALSPVIEAAETLFGAEHGPTAALAGLVGQALAEAETAAGLARGGDARGFELCAQHVRDLARRGLADRAALEAEIASELASREAAARAALERLTGLIAECAIEAPLSGAVLPGTSTLADALREQSAALARWQPRLAALLKAESTATFESALADCWSCIEQTDRTLGAVADAKGMEGMRRQDLLLELNVGALQRRVSGLGQQILAFTPPAPLGRTQHDQLIQAFKLCEADFEGWRLEVVELHRADHPHDDFEAKRPALLARRIRVQSSCDALALELRARHEVCSWFAGFETTYRWCIEDLKFHSTAWVLFEKKLAEVRPSACWSDARRWLPELVSCGAAMLRVKLQVVEIGKLASACLLQIDLAEQHCTALTAEEWRLLDRGSFAALGQLIDAIKSGGHAYARSFLDQGMLSLEVGEAQAEVASLLQVWSDHAQGAQRDLDARQLLIASTPTVSGAKLLRPPFVPADVVGGLSFAGTTCGNLLELVTAMSGGMSDGATGFTVGGRPVMHTSRGSSNVGGSAMGTAFFIYQSDAPGAAIEIVALGRHCNDRGEIGKAQKGQKSNHYLIGWTAAGATVTSSNPLGRQVVELHGKDKLS